MTQREIGGSTYNLTYDYENRLTGVSGAATATFVYDGDGARKSTCTTAKPCGVRKVLTPLRSHVVKETPHYPPAPSSQHLKVLDLCPLPVENHMGVSTNPGEEGEKKSSPKVVEDPERFSGGRRGVRASWGRNFSRLI